MACCGHVVSGTYYEIFVDPRWFNVEVDTTAISSVAGPKSSSYRRVTVKCSLIVPFTPNP